MSVLYVRNDKGEFVPIPALKGDKGESAYEQAKKGGYTGTEEEFIAMLNGLTASLSGVAPISVDAEHYTNYDNPHNVTASQVGLGNVDNTSDADKPVSNATSAAIEGVRSLVTSHTGASNPHGITPANIGAIPTVYGVSTNLNTELSAGSGKMTVCAYDSNTQNTPRTEGATDYAHGMVITNAYTNQYGTQLCLPSGDSSIYVRRQNKNGVTPWERIITESCVKTGSYEGTGTDDAVSIPVGFVPQLLIVTSDAVSPHHGRLIAINGQEFVKVKDDGTTNYNYFAQLTWGSTVTVQGLTSDKVKNKVMNYGNTKYDWIAFR